MNELTEVFEELNKLNEEMNDNTPSWVKRIHRCIEKGVLDPATLEEFIREHEEELPKKYAIETSDGRYWKSSYAEPYADVSDDVNRYGFLFDSERDAKNILRRIKYSYDENYWGSSFEDQEFEIVEIIL